MSRTVPLLLTVAAATSWAAATLLTKVALRELEPLDVLGLELLSSAVAMLCLATVTRRPLLPPNWRAFAVLGVVEPGLAFALVDFGFARTGAADGAILIASQSLFGVLLARLLLAERMPPPVAAGVAVGFAGSALVGLAQSGHGTSLVGDLLVLGGSAAAAVNGVGVRRLARDADIVSATTTQLVAAALIAAPVVVLADATGRAKLGSAGTIYVMAAVATGLLGGAVPFLAFNRAIRELTVARAEVLLNLTPVLAAVGAVLLLDERLHWPEITGGALVVAAAAAVAVSESFAGEVPCPSSH